MLASVSPSSMVICCRASVRRSVVTEAVVEGEEVEVEDGEGVSMVLGLWPQRCRWAVDMALWTTTSPYQYSNNNWAI